MMGTGEGVALRETGSWGIGTALGASSSILAGSNYFCQFNDRVWTDLLMSETDLSVDAHTVAGGSQMYTTASFLRHSQLEIL